MAVRVENVIFFPKKGELLICRGGRFTKMIITKEGNMIELTEYPGHIFDVETGEVFRKNGNKITKVKRNSHGSASFWFVYVNGLKSRLTQVEISAKYGKNIQKVAERKFFNLDNSETI